MPFDIAVDNNGQSQYGDFGDADRVVGEDNTIQQIRLGVLNALDRQRIGGLTSEVKTELRNNLRDVLSNHPYVDAVVSIRLRTPTDETLVADVLTQSDTIEIPFKR